MSQETRGHWFIQGGKWAVSQRDWLNEDHSCTHSITIYWVWLGLGAMLDAGNMINRDMVPTLLELKWKRLKWTWKPSLFIQPSPKALEVPGWKELIIWRQYWFLLTDKSSSYIYHVVCLDSPQSQLVSLWYALILKKKCFQIATFLETSQFATNPRHACGNVRMHWWQHPQAFP